MAFNIKFPQKPSAAGSCSFKASALYNTYVSVPKGTDTAIAPIDPTSSSPLPVVLGDTHFAANGCDDFIVKIEQYDDGDTQKCDSCPAPSTAVPVNIEHYVYLPAGSSIDLPGYIIDYELVAVPRNLWTGDAEADYTLAGVTSDDDSIYIASCRAITPCCTVPNVTNNDGVVVPGDESYLGGKGGSFDPKVRVKK